MGFLPSSSVAGHLERLRDEVLLEHLSWPLKRCSHDFPIENLQKKNHGKSTGKPLMFQS
jgi:hypothetical protein